MVTNEPTTDGPDRPAATEVLDVAQAGSGNSRAGSVGSFLGAGDKVVNHGTMSETPTEPACDWVAIWTLDGAMIKNCWMVMDTATTFLKLKKHNPKLTLG